MRLSNRLWLRSVRSSCHSKKVRSEGGSEISRKVTSQEGDIHVFGRTQIIHSSLYIFLSIFAEGRNSSAMKQQPSNPIGQVLIISYNLFRMNIDQFQEINKNAVGMLVVDEGHRLKNTAGLLTLMALESLKSDARLCITAAPIHNNLSEFYNLVNFVSPGMLGDLATFRRDYNVRLPPQTARLHPMISVLEENVCLKPWILPPRHSCSVIYKRISCRRCCHCELKPCSFFGRPSNSASSITLFRKTQISMARKLMP